MQVLTTNQAAAWTQIVEQCPCHDFYHLPQYHALAEQSGEGEAYLFHHAEGPYSVALPLLLRSLENLPAVRAGGADWLDATSVYGYVGPIASEPNIPERVVQNFQCSLERHLREMGVVAAFSRLHPIYSQQQLLRGMGECQTLSRTVSIDLTLPADLQRAGFRKSHKEGINRLRRRGVSCLHDRGAVHLDAFVDVYHETMRRVGAAPGYCFPLVYFRRLLDALGERFHLFVCRQENKLVCGGVFIECGEILQYHLGGTTNAALKFAPMKLLLDDVRLWANTAGLKFFHLGGGATMNPSDSLLHFKLGFSGGRTHDFSIWRWVLLPNVYRRLCEEGSRWNEANGVEAASSGYFPEYRTPTVPRARLVNPNVLSPTTAAAQGAHS